MELNAEETARAIMKGEIDLGKDSFLGFLVSEIHSPAQKAAWFNVLSGFIQNELDIFRKVADIFRFSEKNIDHLWIDYITAKLK